MKNDLDIEEEMKKIRKQGRSQLIVLISSLVLVFLWFTNFSFWLNQRTFGQEAFYYLGEALSFSPTVIIYLTFIITILFTIFYIHIIKKLAPSMFSD